MTIDDPLKTGKRLIISTYDEKEEDEIHQQPATPHRWWHRELHMLRWQADGAAFATEGGG